MTKIFTYIIMLLLSFLGFSMNQTLFAQQTEQGFELKINNKKMSVYPTPSSNYVTISLPPGLREQTAKVEIMDISGRKVLEQKKYDKYTSEITFNNISELPAGVYVVSALDSEGRLLQSTRLIVNK